MNEREKGAQVCSRQLNLNSMVDFLRRAGLGSKRVILMNYDSKQQLVLEQVHEAEVFLLQGKKQNADIITTNSKRFKNSKGIPVFFVFLS